MKIIDIIILVAYLCGIYPVGAACHGMLSVCRLA